MDLIFNQEEKPTIRNEKKTFKEMKQCPNCLRVVSEIIKVERLTAEELQKQEPFFSEESAIGKILKLFNKTPAKEKYFFVCEKCKMETKK